jgi:RNA 2',3'-cyclic 3'-phosphodiesterase
MGIRSFLAFSLPAEIRSVVEQVHEGLKGASRDVKWVRPASVHLTLVFLGSVDEEEVPALSGAVRGVCEGFGPFRLAVRGTGLFPNPRRPRVIWLGLEGDVERMGGLRDALQEVLEPFGIERERRPFRPHLTLGRFRKGGFMDDRLASAMDGWTEVESPACTLTELVLFKSDLRRGGAVYTELDRFPLSGES